MQSRVGPPPHGGVPAVGPREFLRVYDIYRRCFTFRGEEFDIPTPLGDVHVQVPAGSQTGSVLTVRGKGLPSLSRGGLGDLHIRLQVWTPKNLSVEQQELFRSLAELEGDPPGDESLGRRFWNRVRETFNG